LRLKKNRGKATADWGPGEPCFSDWDEKRQRWFCVYCGETSRMLELRLCDVRPVLYAHDGLHPLDPDRKDRIKNQTDLIDLLQARSKR
jgi:hypothetical protein